MFDRHNPYFASLKEIYKLNSEGSCKETYHVILDSTIPYKVGDSVAILPSHDYPLVKKTLSVLKAHGDETITDKKSGEKRTLKEHLTTKANITKVHSSLLQEVAKRTTVEEKSKWIVELFQKDRHDALNAYLHSFELWDFLEEHSEVHFTPQEIVDLLPPLLPRFYSISSSPLMHKGEIHLTVAMTDYTTRGVLRHGVGTHYLCRIAKVGSKEIPLYIQSAHDFTLPQDESPVIMIGPGTGVAPFKAFVEEILSLESKRKSWLFFGERSQKTDFFYKDLWAKAANCSQFKLSAAFSRDQDHKIYVQDRMKEESKELFRWIEEGAYIFVCGDAHRMAKDVEETLVQIIEKEGHLSEVEARAYLRNLRKTKKYLRDVY